MVLIMKTNTTKTNTKTNVTSEKKSTVKPVEKSTKPVKTNTEKVNKLYSFDEVMKLFNEYKIGSKSKTNNYRIMNGGSSLHVLKREYRLYATSVDFNAISDKKLNDVKCIENDNVCDKLRPHTVTITNNQSLIEVLKILALNKLNAPC